ncbi:LemA family protein [Actinopolymorpha singaporensis]|uniref:LemA protein n=1 Tax=Actinopolymorpha singaporensis TaxID=117157 RepID=A0A1H1LWM6_9ACTN|nr:LemA family protein [Actinopolymorpha singaporensis]SDR78189.1 LemA protein [Actinopolymorpha singaporensis]
MIWIAAAVVLVVLVVAGGVVSYNRFVSQRNLVQDSWRQVDVELHRRYDLVPGLLASVRTHVTGHGEVFAEVTRRAEAAARGGADLSVRAGREAALAEALRRLFAVADRHPALRENEEFLDLQRQVAETEDRIAAGRRFYNANVRAYNTRVEAFPSSLLAARCGFEEAEYFEVEEAQVRAAPAIDFGALGTPSQTPPGDQ